MKKLAGFVLALAVSVAAFPPLMSLAQLMPPGLILPAPQLINPDIIGGSSSGPTANITGGTANSLPYQSGISATSFVSPVNNAVLVTNGTGVPSESSVLPSTTTATTQPYYDSSTKLATTGQVTAAVQAIMATTNFAVSGVGSEYVGTAATNCGGGGTTCTTFSFNPQPTGALTINYSANGGGISALNTIYAGGSGWNVGDVFTIMCGKQDNLNIVTQVSSGAVTGAAVAYIGTGCATGTFTNVSTVVGNTYQYTIHFQGALTANTTFMTTGGTYLTQSNQFAWDNSTTGAYTSTVCQGTPGTDTCAAGGATVVVPQGVNGSQEASIECDGVLNCRLYPLYLGVTDYVGSGGIKSVSATNLVLDTTSASDVQIGTTNAGSVTIGKSGTGTTISGGLTSTAAANSLGATSFSGAITGGQAATLGVTMVAAGSVSATGLNFGTAGTGLYGSSTAVNTAISGTQQFGVAANGVVVSPTGSALNSGMVIGLASLNSGWANSYGIIQGVNGYMISTDGTSSNSFQLASNAYRTASGTPGTWNYAASSTATVYGQNAGVHRFYTAILGAKDAAITWNDIADISSTGLAVTGTQTVTSASANSLAVGRLGSTTPAFNVDSSTASQVAGLNVTGAATGGTVAITAIDSGSNTSISFNAKGSGTMTLNTTGTGAVTVGNSTGGVKFSGSLADAGGRLLVSNTAPAISSGFNTSSYACTTCNNTSAFEITVGTGTGTSTGVVTMPTANVGWACSGDDITTKTEVLHETAFTTTSVTFVAYAITTGLATNFTNSDVLVFHCTAF